MGVHRDRCGTAFGALSGRRAAKVQPVRKARHQDGLLQAGCSTSQSGLPDQEAWKVHSAGWAGLLASHVLAFAEVRAFIVEDSVQEEGLETQSLYRRLASIVFLTK